MSLLLLLHSFVALQLVSLTLTEGDAGSTVDAMSDAIEGADVMLYGVSLAYKESANVSDLSNLRVSEAYPVHCSSCICSDAAVVAGIFSAEWKLTTAISKSSI